jgi:hypothetical protein
MIPMTWLTGTTAAAFTLIVLSLHAGADGSWTPGQKPGLERPQERPRQERPIQEQPRYEECEQYRECGRGDYGYREDQDYRRDQGHYGHPDYVWHHRPHPAPMPPPILPPIGHGPISDLVLDPSAMAVRARFNPWGETPDLDPSSP